MENKLKTLGREMILLNYAIVVIIIVIVSLLIGAIITDFHDKDFMS